MCFYLQVVAHVNNGRGEYMTSVKPKTSLCDGIFHKISGETKLRIALIANTNIKPYQTKFEIMQSQVFNSDQQ